MDQIQQHKEQIEKQIVDTGIDRYGDGTISKEELGLIADFAVVGMNMIKTQGDLSNFLTSLVSRWPIFQNIATIEEAHVKEAADSQVYSGALALAKDGKIENAIRLAKTATANSAIN